VRRRYGRSAKGQQQILRMTVEAQDQQALLTQEDTAEILGTDIRTISGMGSSLRLTLVDHYGRASRIFHVPIQDAMLPAVIKGWQGAGDSYRVT
jgi:hypothetical protein